MTAPATYDELKEMIARTYAELSPQLQRIARFALEKPNDLALGTVAAVAQASGAQPSAMIRFANALGYRGFSDMQQVFRGHLVERSTSYRDRIEQLRQASRNGQRAPSGVLHQLIGEAAAELGHIEEHIPEASLKEAVRLIASAPRLFVLAQRRAFPVAAYLSYALTQLELKAHLLDGAGGMLRDHLRLIDRGDLLLVASFRNYSPDVIEAASACAARGVAVVAITDSPLSPLVEPARVSLQLADDSSRPFRSLVGPMCLAQALVVSTGHLLAERASRRHGTPARRTAR